MFAVLPAGAGHTSEIFKPKAISLTCYKNIILSLFFRERNEVIAKITAITFRKEWVSMQKNCNKIFRNTYFKRTILK